MITEIVMPKLGFTMEKGQVARWVKKEEDFVKKGEILFEVETDKVNLEVEAKEEGFLRKIIITKGETVDVGTVIGIISDKNESIPKKYLKGKISYSEEKSVIESVEETTKRDQEQKAKQFDSIQTTPAVRLIAKEKGIDLSVITGSGPGGITERDIKKYLEQSVSVLRNEEELPNVIKVRGIRKVIASRMSESSQTTASVTLMAELDCTKVVNIRKEMLPKIQKEREIKVSYLDFFIWAASRALNDFPTVNSSIKDDQIILRDSKNIGIAVDIPEGLIVPIIKEVEKKNIIEIAKERFELIKKAQKNRLIPDEVNGGTFTISNLGMFTIDYFTPIINLPEVAILGLGSIKEKAIVEEGRVIIKPVVNLSLSFDHRVVDGAPASRFLQLIINLLKNTEMDHYLK